MRCLDSQSLSSLYQMVIATITCVMAVGTAPLGGAMVLLSSGLSSSVGRATAGSCRYPFILTLTGRSEGRVASTRTGCLGKEV